MYNNNNSIGRFVNSNHPPDVNLRNLFPGGSFPVQQKMMLVPPGYVDCTTYFVDTLSFLKEYSWVYNFPVTEILVRNVFEHIPDDWTAALLALTNEELNSFPQGFVKDDWPPTLIKFCRQCQALRIPARMAIEQGPELPQKIRRGLTPKKQHEVASLAELVHAECSGRGVSHVLDVGAGLGYLGQLLHHRYGYSVLGLESQVDRVETANCRQFKVSPTADVKYISCNISSNSIPSIESVLSESGSKQSCMVGLHTCGDLTVNAMQVFLQLDCVKLMALVPCCYHKMAMSDTEIQERTVETFLNFPLSASLRKLVDMSDSRTYLRRPFLRLAAQETMARWQHWSEEDHKQHSVHVLSRAVLQLFANKEQLVLKKKCRRAVRKTNRSKFESFIDDALQRYEFIAEGSETSRDISDISQRVAELWQHYEKFCHLAEVFTALQASVQGVAETLVLADRAAFLQEHRAVSSVELVKVMDDALSPRCLALVARK